MKALKKTFLVLVSLVFIIFAWVFLLGKGIDDTILSFNFYQKLEEEFRISQNLNQFILKEITKNLTQETSDNYQAVIQRSFAQVFDQARTKEIMFLVIEDFLAWVRGGEENLYITIDLKKEQEELQENFFISFNEDLVSQLELYGDSIDLKELVIKKVSWDNQQIIPEKIVITQDDLPREIENFVNYTRGYYKYSIYIFAFILALFILIYLGLAGIRDGFKWLGFSMLLAGGLFFLFIKGLGGFLIKIIPNLSIKEIQNYPALLEIIQLTLNQLVLPSLIFAFLGLIILILNFVFKQIE